MAKTRKITLLAFTVCLIAALCALFGIPAKLAKAAAEDDFLTFTGEVYRLGGQISSKNPLKIDLDRNGHILPYLYSENETTGIVSYLPQYRFEGSGFSVNYVNARGQKRSCGSGYAIYNSQMNLVTFKYSEDGATAVRVFRDKNDEIEIKQTVIYYEGLYYYDVLYEVKTLVAEPLTEVKLYAGGATYLGSSAISTGAAFDKISNRLSVNIASGLTMFMQGVTAPGAYYAGQNDVAASITAGADLSNAISSSGNTSYYMQWNAGSLAQNESYTVRMVEGLSKPSFITVLGGGTKVATPGTMVTLEYDVKVKNAGRYTFGVHSKLDNAVSLQEYEGFVDFAANETKRVYVMVEIPEVVQKPVVDCISLSVISSSGDYTASWETALDINGSSPNIVDTEFTYDYDVASETVRSVTILFTPINIETGVSITGEILNNNRQSFSPKKTARIEKYEGGSVSLTILGADLNLKLNSEYYFQIKIKGYEKIDLVLKMENVPVTGVKITKYPGILYTGNVANLKATCVPATAINNRIEWSIVEGDATVNPVTGELKVGKTPGSVRVSAKHAGGAVSATVLIVVEQGIDAMNVAGLPAADSDGNIYIERALSYTLKAEYLPQGIISDDMIRWNLSGDGAELKDNVLAVGHNSPVGSALTLTVYPSTNPELIKTYTLVIKENASLKSFQDKLGMLSEENLLYEQIAVVEQLYRDYDNLIPDIKLHITADNREKMQRLSLAGDAILTRLQALKAEFLDYKAKSEQGDDKLLPLKQEFNSFLNMLRSIEEQDLSLFAMLTEEYDGMLAILERTDALYDAANALKDEATALFGEIAADSNRLLIADRGRRLISLAGRMDALLPTQREYYLAERSRVAQFISKFNALTATLNEIGYRLDALAIIKDGALIDEGLIAKRGEVALLIEHINDVCVTDKELQENGNIYISTYLTPALARVESLTKEVEGIRAKLAAMAAMNADALLQNAGWLDTLKGWLTDGLHVELTAEQCGMLAGEQSLISSLTAAIEALKTQVAELDGEISAKLTYFAEQFITDEGIIAEQGGIDALTRKYDKLCAEQKKLVNADNYAALRTVETRIVARKAQIKEQADKLIALGIYTDSEAKKYNDTVLFVIADEAAPNRLTLLKEEIAGLLAAGDSLFTEEQKALITAGVLTDIDDALAYMQYLVDTVRRLQVELDTLLTELKTAVDAEQGSVLANIELFNEIAAKLSTLTLEQQGALATRFQEINALYIAEYEPIQDLENLIAQIEQDRSYMTSLLKVNQILSDLSVEYNPEWEVSRWQYAALQERRAVLTELKQKAMDAEADVAEKRQEYESYLKTYVDSSGQILNAAKPLILDEKSRVSAFKEIFFDLPVEKQMRLSDILERFEVMSAEILRQEKQVFSYADQLINGGYLVYNEVEQSWTIVKIEGLIALEEQITLSIEQLNALKGSLYEPQRRLADVVLSGLVLAKGRISGLKEQAQNKDTLLKGSLSSLGIWKKQNGEVVIENGLWKIATNEGIYLAWETVAKAMLEEISVLTLEQQQLMTVYKQCNRIKTVYDELQRQVNAAVVKINALGIFDDMGTVITEGIIAKLVAVSEAAAEVNAFTAEQKSRMSSLIGKLNDAKASGDSLKATVDKQNALIAGCYKNGSILTDGLIAKRAEIERFRTMYLGGSLTVEQKRLLEGSYNKTADLISKIRELQQQTDEFKARIDALVAASGSGDNGIIAMYDDVNGAIVDYNSVLTSEQKTLLGTEFIQLNSLFSRIKTRKAQVEDLIRRYGEVIGQGDDGLISKLATLEILVADMSNALKLTAEQLQLVSNQKNELVPRLSRAKLLKSQVDDILQKSARGELYTKSKYGNGEIGKIEALLDQISVYTVEQRLLLSEVITAASEDLSLAKALRQQVEDIIAAIAKIDIWKQIPVFGSSVTPILDTEKIMFLDPATAELIRSTRSDIAFLEGAFTTEQRLDIDAAYAALKVAEQLLIEYDSLRYVLDMYKNLGVTYANLLSKEETIKELNAIILALPIESQQNIADIVKTLDEYQRTISVLYSQISLIVRLTNEIELYGNNILSIGDELKDIEAYINKRKAFTNGEYITDEQLAVLRRQGTISTISEKLALYDSLNAIVESINRELADLKITSDNLYSKKDGILAVLARINSGELTQEQEYKLLATKAQCELYLIEIEELDNEIASAHRAVSAIDGSTGKLFANKAEINRVYNMIMRMTDGQKQALKNDITILSNMLNMIKALEEQVGEIKLEVDVLRTTAKIDLITKGNEIDALYSKIAVLTGEQKGMLDLQIKYLDELRTEYGKQNQELNALISDILALPEYPIRENYELVVSVNARYEKWAHKELIEETIVKYLKDCYATLLSNNLTDIETGISVDLGGSVKLDENVLLTVSAVSSESNLYSLFENVLIKMNLGNTVKSVFVINLTKDSVIYVPTVNGRPATMQLKMRIPGGFNAQKNKLLLVNSDGSLTEMRFSLADGYLYFDTNALGTFVISDERFIFPTLWVSLGAGAIVALSLLIYCINRVMKKAKLSLEYDNGMVKITIIPPSKPIKNIGIYINGVLIEQHYNPSTIYYVDDVEDGSKITVYYDFSDQKTRFPRYITKVPSLKSASKILKI